jgi:hypothetical protein
MINQPESEQLLYFKKTRRLKIIAKKLRGIDA